MKKRLIILLSIILLIIFLILFISLYDFRIKEIETTDLINVELDKCIDGDTAWFKINGKNKKYRFLAIDAKELDTTDGKLASDYVCDILTNAKKIEIKYDKLGEIKDKY